MLGRIRRTWKSFRSFRRLHFTRGGLMFSVGTLAVGFAAINTANNLLYLILGAMLGAILVSGWLSEHVLRNASVKREPTSPATVGVPASISYEVENQARWLPTVSLEIREAGLAHPAWVPFLPAGGRRRARAKNTFVRRGVYPLETVTLATTFPFGLFLKERDVELPGELLVYPRTDRPVRRPRLIGSLAGRERSAARGGSGVTGEYRSLRDYLPGDDPRDIHWRSSARRGQLVIRQYERDGGEAVWICLDLGHPPGEAAEVAVEIAAALAHRAESGSQRYGLATMTHRVMPGLGPGHLSAVLEALARVDFSSSAPALAAPDDPARCILVSASPAGVPGFSDHLHPGEALS